jgi:chromosome segregation ATPase
MEHNDHQHDSKPYTREDHELDMLRFKQEIKEMEEELASRQGVVAPIDKENKKLAEALKGVEKTVKMAEDVDEQVLLKKIKKMEDKIKGQKEELKNIKTENITLFSSLKSTEQEKLEVLLSICNLVAGNERLERKIEKAENELSDENLDTALDKLVEDAVRELMKQSQQMQIVNPNALDDDE